jgi:hypothetical protein
MIGNAARRDPWGESCPINLPVRVDERGVETELRASH